LGNILGGGLGIHSESNPLLSVIISRALACTNFKSISKFCNAKITPNNFQIKRVNPEFQNSAGSQKEYSHLKFHINS
jgi:hypothetical protein